MFKQFFRGILWSAIFCLLVFLGACPCVSAEDIPGDTEDNPIVIKSCADLEVFTQDVSNGNSYKGKYIRLENDIYLTRHETENGRPIKWEPIGFAAFSSHNKEKLVKTKSFDGFFDGNGKTIYCNINGFYQSNKFCKASAIFGCLGENGIIKNLIVKGKVQTNNIKVSPAVLCNVNLGTIKNCELTATVKNAKGVNGISFANYGEISDCKVSGTFETNDLNCSAVASLNYGKIDNCQVDAVFSNGKNGDSNDEYKYQTETAGISNFNKGEISNCHVNASISSSKAHKAMNSDNKTLKLMESYRGVAGGIAALNEGLIKDCSFSGCVSSFYAGGIVGMNCKTVDSCSINNAQITGVMAGNFVGANLGDFKEKGTVNNCKSDNSIVIIAKENN